MIKAAINRLALAGIRSVMVTLAKGSIAALPKVKSMILAAKISRRRSRSNRATETADFGARPRDGGTRRSSTNRNGHAAAIAGRVKAAARTTTERLDR